MVNQPRIKDGEWLYEKEGREIWNTAGESFPTKAEAIEEGQFFLRQEKKEGYYHHNTFQIGQVKDVAVEIDPNDVIDLVRDQVYNQVGEVAEDWLRYVEQSDTERLGKRLNAVFKHWLCEINEEPRFFQVDNIESFKLTEGHQDDNSNEETSEHESETRFA